MPGKFWTTCYQTSSRLLSRQLACPSTQGGEAAGAQGQLWSCAEVGGPMPTVSATAPATATRRPPSPILTHRLRWRIAAHLVGDEVFTFGRPSCLYCKRGQLQGRKVRPPPCLQPPRPSRAPPSLFPPFTLAQEPPPCPSLHGRHPRSRSTGTTALPLRSSYFPRAPASAGARNFRGRRHLHPLGPRRKGEPDEIDMRCAERAAQPPLRAPQPPRPPHARVPHLPAALHRPRLACTPRLHLTP